MGIIGFSSTVSYLSYNTLKLSINPNNTSKFSIILIFIVSIDKYKSFLYTIDILYDFIKLYEGVEK